MAELAIIATLASTAVSAIGTIATGKARAEQLQAEGLAAQQEAEFRAQQEDVRAREEIAAGQQEAAQKKREKELALSTLQARGAASGFETTSVSDLALAGEIAERGTLQEQAALHGGFARASQRRLNAAGVRFSGASALAARTAEARSTRRSASISAAGTILGGIGRAGSIGAEFGAFGSGPAPTSGRYARPT